MALTDEAFSWKHSTRLAASVFQRRFGHSLEELIDLGDNVILVNDLQQHEGDATMKNLHTVVLTLAVLVLINAPAFARGGGGGGGGGGMGGGNGGGALSAL